MPSCAGDVSRSSFPRPQLTDTTATLQSGDVVVLYTDGVTEGRRNRQFFDEERLLGVIDHSAAMNAQGIAEAIVAAALDFQHGDAKDDMAVVVIKVP